MPRYLFCLLLFSTPLAGQDLAALAQDPITSRSVVNAGDTARLQQALAKGRRGEPVTVAVIGGSISGIASWKLTPLISRTMLTPAAFDYAFYPSDLYYADLAKADGRFEDWNASRDGFHGQYFGEVRGEKNKDGPINEDQVDYLPEIGVGRWPVSTVREITVR